MSKSTRQRSEKKLKRLREDYEKIKQEIANLGHVVPGTLQERSYRCGKPYCHCKKDGILHGPYYHWTRKVDGKTVSVNLDKEAATIVQECIQNNRKLRTLCARLEKTSLEILKIIANLQNT
jgi:hypothetical protein